MRLPIDTSRLQFLVVSGAEPLKQYEADKPREAWAARTDDNGEVLWRVQLVALGDGAAQIMRVTVVGDPGVSQGEMVRVEGMTAQPWEMDGRNGMAFRGHCLTKSRRYSTTFKQLRADREAWVHQQILARSRDQTQRALAGAVERIVLLECDGIGHVTAADRHYALAEYARARERRRIGREECCGEPKTAIKATRRAPVGEDESHREAMRDE